VLQIELPEGSRQLRIEPFLEFVQLLHGEGLPGFFEDQLHASAPALLLDEWRV
jgi:hypothetical protein